MFRVFPHFYSAVRRDLLVPVVLSFQRPLARRERKRQRGAVEPKNIKVKGPPASFEFFFLLLLLFYIFSF